MRPNLTLGSLAKKLAISEHAFVPLHIRSNHNAIAMGLIAFTIRQVSLSIEPSPDGVSVESRTTKYSLKGFAI